MGFQTWGFVTLQAILEAGYDVPLVITHPESQHVYETIWNESVQRLAQKHNIPTVVCQRADDEALIGRVRDVRPDVILSSDWRTWIRPELFRIPPGGTLNLHDALLPRYGGFAPLNWAIVNGETETGVTVHYVDEDLDLGDILLQRRVAIDPEDTATDLFRRTLPLFGTLAIEALELIRQGRARRSPQDRSQATFFHKRCERDSRIDWTQPRTRIYNLVRAQSDPYPNAFTTYRGQRLKIKRARLATTCFCGTPGRVFCRTEHGVVVLGGADAGGPNQGLVIETVQAEGEPPRPANEFFARMGDYLGED